VVDPIIINSKFQPWKDTSSSVTSTPTSTLSTSENLSPPKRLASPPPNITPTKPNNSPSKGDRSMNEKNEPRWPLLGPYINQFVYYASPTAAWLFTDDVGSQLARVFMTKLTNSENMGGTRCKNQKNKEFSNFMFLDQKKILKILNKKNR